MKEPQTHLEICPDCQKWICTRNDEDKFKFEPDSFCDCVDLSELNDGI